MANSDARISQPLISNPQSSGRGDWIDTIARDDWKSYHLKLWKLLVQNYALALSTVQIVVA